MALIRFSQSYPASLHTDHKTADISLPNCSLELGKMPFPSNSTLCFGHLLFRSYVTLWNKCVLFFSVTV